MPIGSPTGGANVAKLLAFGTSSRPANVRTIVRRGHPRPGAQLRFDDVDGYPAHRVRHEHRAADHSNAVTPESAPQPDDDTDHTRSVNRRRIEAEALFYSCSR